jgi:P-loop Domain of unknown function (DUF2791)
MSMPISPRAAIRRLRSGVVPFEILDEISVGYAAAAKEIGARLTALRRIGEAPPLLVRGEWGSGKTHFLAFAREVAARHGLPSAAASLNARATPLSHPQKILPVLARDFCAPGVGRGLRALVLAWIASDQDRPRLERFASTSEAGSLAGPLSSLCYAWRQGAGMGIANHPAVGPLLGTDLSWADYGYKRYQALERIQSLSLLMRWMGLKGLVLTLDELETIDQLWNVRSRFVAYAVLGRLCQMRAIWPVLGITERFELTISRDIEFASRTSTALDPSVAWLFDAWRRRILEEVAPPPVDGEAARSLALNVLQLYRDAYPMVDAGEDDVSDAVTEWKADPARNPRRLIRLVVNQLDRTRWESTAPALGSHHRDLPRTAVSPMETRRR